MSYHLVTIIMPVYNAEKYVFQAIESVLNQTYANWELIIVNDASTDDSRQIIASFNDDRILVFEFQENKGVSAARNLALEKMRGDFFCFLDADDRLTSRSLSLRLEVFKRDSEVSFVDGVIEIWDKEFRKLNKLVNHTFSGNPQKLLCALDSRCFFGPTWMVKVEKEKKYRFEERLSHGEDLLFYISISNTGIYTAVMDPVYQYRKGHSSAMSDLKALGNGYLYILKKLVQNPNIDTDAVKTFQIKSKRIMFKSFVSQKLIVEAFKYLFK